MNRVNFYLSLSDLLLLDGFAEAYASNDPKQIERYLYQNGLDVEEKYETDEMFHRNLQNKAVKCLRYVGFERRDPRWLKSGAASMEAVINSTHDNEMINDLRNMNRQGYSGQHEEMGRRYVQSLKKKGENIG